MKRTFRAVIKKLTNWQGKAYFSDIIGAVQKLVPFLQDNKKNATLQHPLQCASSQFLPAAVVSTKTIFQR
jgi:hypothetical protein